MTGRLKPYGILTGKGLKGFKDNILRDGFQRYPLNIPDGGSGRINIQNPRY
jgi:hypothetical protein